MEATQRRVLGPTLVAAIVLVSSGCRGSSRATESAYSGELTVLAAASLAEPLTAARDRLVEQHRDLSVSLSFAGSPSVVRQLQQGAPADVVATADEATMDRLVQDGLVDPPRVFTRNRLEIVVAPANPKRITGLADLGRGDVAVVLAAPGVPAGRYAREALSRAGVAVSPRSLETDVRLGVFRVSSGEADATVAYVTDVRAAKGRVIGVPIPDDQNVVTAYLVAVTRESDDRQAAAGFVDDLVSGRGQQALLDHGFLPP